MIVITPEEFGMDREAVRQALEAENIEARPVWKPMHLQPVFEVEKVQRVQEVEEVQTVQKVQGVEQTYKARVVGGEIAEDLFNRGLCLPSGTAMTEEDLERVIKVIRKCCKSE